MNTYRNYALYNVGLLFWRKLVTFASEIPSLHVVRLLFTKRSHQEIVFDFTACFQFFHTTLFQTTIF